MFFGLAEGRLRVVTCERCETNKKNRIRSNPKLDLKQKAKATSLGETVAYLTCKQHISKSVCAS